MRINFRPPKVLTEEHVFIVRLTRPARTDGNSALSSAL